MAQVLSFIDIAERKRDARFPSSVISQDARLLEIYSGVARAARTNSSVLICGETGTGKELIANALHEGSQRRNHEMVTLNCGAFPSELIESELFGHEKNSFTGSGGERRIGRFELAQGSTLFLDEIGSMPIKQQTKLLRAIETKRISRLGGQREFHVDTRIIAATNQPLEELVHRGQFRQDLMYRLRVICFEIPPLRDRLLDIPLLVDHFVARYCLEFERPLLTMSDEAMDRFMSHNWPGNVRELQNMLEGIIATIPDAEKTIKPRHIRFPKVERDADVIEYRGGLMVATNQFQARYIAKVLMEHNWDRSSAARYLQVHRNTLGSRIKQLKIEMSSSPSN